jgi:hypothetical protein
LCESAGHSQVTASLPVEAPTEQAALSTGTGNPTALLSKLDGTLNLVGAVQVGDSGTDAGVALAVKSNVSLVVVGTTGPSGFPVTHGTTLNGTTDAFLLSYTFGC